MIYLDNAATTPVAPEVRCELEPMLDACFGNPSSSHPLGLEAARAVGLARERIARALGVRSPEQVCFTSGGTEANNLALFGAVRARRRRGRHVLVGPTEHPSIRAAGAALADEGFVVETLRLLPGGALDLEHLRDSLRPETVAVALMLVNNEFGSRYPVEEAARAIRAESPAAHLHVDAIQALGKVRVSLPELDADSLSISGHKIHGLKGTGALVLKEGAKLQPLFHGGGQQAGLRPGTENTVGIVALGRAVELAATHQEQAARDMLLRRSELERELARVPGAELLTVPGGPEHGDQPTFSPAIAAVRLPGPPAEVWMHHLEERGVYTSVGSACQAKTRSVSPALMALGLNEAGAKQILRVSLGRRTTADEVRGAVDALCGVAGDLRVDVARAKQGR